MASVSNKSKGFTLIEIVIVMGILALAIIPIYQNIIQTRVTVTKARFSYIALQLAREKMEEMMSIPYDDVKSHPWRPISGPVVSEDLLQHSPRGGKGKTSATLGRTLAGGFGGGNRIVPGAAGQSVIDPSVQVGEGDYPAQYQRFEVRTAVSKKGKRFKRVEVDVRWYEKGEKDVRQNRYLYSLSSLIANHHLAAYK